MELIIDFIIGAMVGGVVSAVIMCLMNISKDPGHKDLIDRQKLLAEMDAQEKGFIDSIRLGEDRGLVAPSWNLAKTLLNEMPGEGRE